MKALIRFLFALVATPIFFFICAPVWLLADYICSDEGVGMWLIREDGPTLIKWLTFGVYNPLKELDK